MVDQKGTMYYQTPYKFNGKELDEETGLYYYGARYYDPRESIWMSVDPLAEKYPNVSPYVNCFDNPVKFVDPDGKDPGMPYNTLEEAAHDFGLQYNGLSISLNQEIGTVFYKSYDKKTGKDFYSYIVPSLGGGGGAINHPERLKKNQVAVADGHTHAGDMSLYKNPDTSKDCSDNNKFAEPDLNGYDMLDRKGNPVKNVYNKKIIGVLATSNGALLIYNPNVCYSKTGKKDNCEHEIYEYEKPIFKDLPSDPGSKTLRLNREEPNKMPNVLPDNYNPKYDKKRDGY